MMLQSHDLVKAFGGVTAINHLSLEVEKGTVFGIIVRMVAGRQPSSTW